MALQRRRIQALVDLFEDFEKKRPRGVINMSMWGSHAGAHPPEQDAWCGTTCCALGWATTIPLLRRAGLKGEWVESYRWTITDPDRLRLSISFEDKKGDYHTSEELVAGAMVFGMSQCVSSYIFGGDLLTKKRVIIALRSLLEYGEDEFIRRRRLSHY